MQPDELYDWVPDKGVRAPNHKDIQLWRDEKGRTMFEYDRVDRLELEFNNTCFLYCGGCGRTFNPKIEAAGKRIISLEDVKRFFPPEFRNRLDATITFAKLGKPVMLKIVGKFMKELKDQVKQKNVKFTITDEALDYLVDKGFDPKMGARPLQRVIDKDIKRPLSRALLFGDLKNGGNITIKLVDDKIELEVDQVVEEV